MICLQDRLPVLAPHMRGTINEHLEKIVIVLERLEDAFLICLQDRAPHARGTINEHLQKLVIVLERLADAPEICLQDRLPVLAPHERYDFHTVKKKSCMLWTDLQTHQQSVSRTDYRSWHHICEGRL